MKYKKYFRKTSLKQPDIGEKFLSEIASKKPKNFLEIGVFHGVTARNVCELLHSIHQDNFKYIGLVLLAFPEAKIIHVKRNPAATCWSNFTHYFPAKGLDYCYDLNDLVNYYGLYQSLMEFWQEQFGNRIYNLNYDNLTINQEEETRVLLEYLGLQWDESCLSPQNNQRMVRTASQQQVRQKVYQGSSQKWRKFEPFIAGVFDSLMEFN